MTTCFLDEHDKPGEFETTSWYFYQINKCRIRIFNNHLDSLSFWLFLIKTCHFQFKTSSLAMFDRQDQNWNQLIPKTNQNKNLLLPGTQIYFKIAQKSIQYEVFNFIVHADYITNTWESLYLKLDALDVVFFGQSFHYIHDTRWFSYKQCFPNHSPLQLRAQNTSVCHYKAGGC